LILEKGGKIQLCIFEGGGRSGTILTAGAGRKGGAHSDRETAKVFHVGREERSQAGSLFNKWGGEWTCVAKGTTESGGGGK